MCEIQGFVAFGRQNPYVWRKTGLGAEHADNAERKILVASSNGSFAALGQLKLIIMLGVIFTEFMEMVNIELFSKIYYFIPLKLPQFL